MPNFEICLVSIFNAELKRYAKEIVKQYSSRDFSENCCNNVKVETLVGKLIKSVEERLNEVIEPKGVNIKIINNLFKHSKWVPL